MTYLLEETVTKNSTEETYTLFDCVFEIAEQRPYNQTHYNKTQGEKVVGYVQYQSIPLTPLSELLCTVFQ